jgi:hypothetical protein
MSEMLITLNSCANELDPSATTENPQASLEAYLKLCAAALQAEWPEATVITNDAPSLGPIHCYEFDSDDHFVAGDICAGIYATGMFWQ